MAIDKLTLPVLISSKQAEFAVERDDIIRIMKPMPLLAVDAAENWAPEALPVEEKSVRQAAGCAIYVGLFGCIYSEPTVLEYKAAAGNSYREILVYVKDCATRQPKLADFLDQVADPKNGHKLVRYSEWSTVRRRFRDHLWEAIGRMVQHALRLGDPPAAMGEDSSVFDQRWQLERAALLDLGLPDDPQRAKELAILLENEKDAQTGGLLRRIFARH